MTDTTLIANLQDSALATLRFITCGSVDDGKSTLIGRLLVDSRAVMQDQLAGASSRVTQTLDLALLTDGLTAEREQGITIDVAYRYFATSRRKFIIGDTPGHEQYTRNMVTAASTADAAVVLVDATKTPIDAHGQAQLLPQTRRHSLLAHLLRVPAILFVVNKLDAVDQPEQRFAQVRAALLAFAAQAQLPVQGVIPISALRGDNVAARAEAGWCGYAGPSLLETLEALDVSRRDDHHDTPMLAVQWIEQRPLDGAAQDSPATPRESGTGVQRVLWCRVATGTVALGQTVAVAGRAQAAQIVELLDHRRSPRDRVASGHSVGIVLDRDVDISRGDWLGPPQSSILGTRQLRATVAWLDDEPLSPARAYWALHGRRWVKAKVSRIHHRIDITTLAHASAEGLGPNDIAEIDLTLNADIPALPYRNSRALGSLVLVDAASQRTVAAVLVQ